jgi:hypothetical protein
VSGSSTTVNVALVETSPAATLPSKDDALEMLIVVPPEVTADVNVVC